MTTAADSKRCQDLARLLEGPAEGGQVMPRPLYVESLFRSNSQAAKHRTWT